MYVYVFFHFQRNCILLKYLIERGTIVIPIQQPKNKTRFETAFEYAKTHTSLNKLIYFLNLLHKEYFVTHLNI